MKKPQIFRFHAFLSSFRPPLSCHHSSFRSLSIFLLLFFLSFSPLLKAITMVKMHPIQNCLISSASSTEMTPKLDFHKYDWLYMMVYYFSETGFRDHHPKTWVRSCGARIWISLPSLRIQTGSHHHVVQRPWSGSRRTGHCKFDKKNIRLQEMAIEWDPPSPLLQSHYQENPEVTNSLLKYRPRRADNGKRITCRAQNPAMPLSAIEDSLVLAVMCEFLFI